MSTMAERMLGMSSGPARAPNTYPLWRYLLILSIVALGFIYALPNLFPPDYALQIRPDSSEATYSGPPLPVHIFLNGETYQG